jgi:hypothetical protein
MFDSPLGDQRTQLGDSRESISGLLDGATTALMGIQGFRSTFVGLQGISRVINRASRRAGDAMDNIISSLEGLKALYALIIQLFDEKLAE